MPGAMTPSEILTAWKAGADVVKVFPGRVGTPGFFQDLKGPLPQIRMMPTGNVDLNTAPEYIKAGAVAVGVGKALVDIKAVKAKQFDIITENASTFRRIVDEARGVSR
jgi:2-dehydro-3-deoxyphosphogluconate aldolase/(4S)-4-hydroxy-2-oxoglutarate aldolase